MLRMIAYRSIGLSVLVESSALLGQKALDMTDDPFDWFLISILLIRCCLLSCQLGLGLFMGASQCPVTLSAIMPATKAFIGITSCRSFPDAASNGAHGIVWQLTVIQSIGIDCLCVSGMLSLSFSWESTCSQWMCIILLYILVCWEYFDCWHSYLAFFLFSIIWQTSLNYHSSLRNWLVVIMSPCEVLGSIACW